MAIVKWYEISCDYCNAAIGHFQGNLNIVKIQLKNDGGVIIKDKHYCDKFCAEKDNDNT